MKLHPKFLTQKQMENMVKSSISCGPKTFLGRHDFISVRLDLHPSLEINWYILLLTNKYDVDRDLMCIQSQRYYLGQSTKG